MGSPPDADDEGNPITYKSEKNCDHYFEEAESFVEALIREHFFHKTYTSTDEDTSGLAFASCIFGTFRKKL